MDRHINHVRLKLKHIMEYDLDNAYNIPIGTRIEKRFLLSGKGVKYLKWYKGTIIRRDPYKFRQYFIYFDDGSFNWYSLNLSSLKSCYQILSFPDEKNYHIIGQGEGIEKRLPYKKDSTCDEVRPAILSLVMLKQKDEISNGIVISYDKETNKHAVLINDKMVSLVLNDRIKNGGTHTWYTLHPEPPSTDLSSKKICFNLNCNNQGKYRIGNEYKCFTCIQKLVKYTNL